MNKDPLLFSSTQGHTGKVKMQAHTLGTKKSFSDKKEEGN